jgi:ferredoxin
MKKPVVDLSECIRCGVCEDVCPEVFCMTDAGYIAVATIECYPVALVDEVIRCCPADCIDWQEE